MGTLGSTQLNLGCGYQPLEGFLNVDFDAKCNPDAIVNLEHMPWPFTTDQAKRVVMHHVLEHLAPDPSHFLKLMQELYRICAPNALIQLTLPHPRHDEYLTDPTHVRPFLPETFHLFSQSRNLDWQARRVSNTCLALRLGVDFEVTRVSYDLDPRWRLRLEANPITRDELADLITSQSNVARQFSVELKVRKDATKTQASAATPPQP
ncbi:MAG: class I SAM-dependent methyltransferase [Myxococcales bacterium FL481]|nr:MAG: class I SAM-dependent methyltransferase [Myxococcales bacterium FL481]